MEPININAFKNKKTKDSQPDYTGTDRDKKVRVAIWIKDGKKNPDEKYFSMKISDNVQVQKEAF